MTDIGSSQHRRGNAGTDGGRYRTYFEQSPHGVFIADARGFYVEANPAAAAMTGYCRDELVGMNLADVTGPEDRQRAQQAFASLVEHGSSQGRYSFVRKDGEVRYWTVHAVRLSVDRLLAYVTDVTTSVRAEDALRKSEEKYRTLVESSPYCIHQIDAHGDLISMNRAGLDMIGESKEEAIVGVPYLSAVCEADRPRIAELMRRAYRGEPSEFEFRGAVGTDFRSNFVPIEGAGDVVERLLGITQDVTELKAAETSLRELEANMLRTQKLESLGVMAGGIAHDFNNLLVPISATLELIQSQAMSGSPVAGRCLEAARTAAARASDLCGQLLAYSGQGHCKVEALDVSEQVEQSRQLLEMSGKTATIRFALADGLPAIKADAAQLQQVLMNLVVNAAEAATEEGSVDVVVSTWADQFSRQRLASSYLGEAAPDAGPFVVLEVADNGAGMDEQALCRLFEPFFTTKFTGRGLGLAAVLGIVRGHGAGIEVQSAIGSGTTMRIMFPALAFTAASSVTGAPVPRKGCQALHVLVVDDEQVVRDSVATILELHGHRVTMASAGAQALDLYAAAGGDYHVVLLDLSMPDMDGEATLKRLLGIDPEVRVVISSGYPESTVRRGRELDSAVAFVQKPFAVDSLLRALEAT